MAEAIYDELWAKCLPGKEFNILCGSDLIAAQEDHQVDFGPIEETSVCVADLGERIGAKSPGARYVLLLRLPKHDSQIGVQNVQHIEYSLLNILDTAADLGVQSLALPVLGISKHGYPHLKEQSPSYVMTYWIVKWAHL